MSVDTLSLPRLYPDARRSPTDNVRYRISCFDHLRDTSNPRHCSLECVIGAIRAGRWQPNVVAVTYIYRREGKSLAYRRAKSRLPLFTPGGTFRIRCNAALVQASGVAGYDLDGLPADEIERLEEGLRLDPHTVFMFRSPSGIGIKLGLSIPLVHSDAAYKPHWYAGAEYLKRHYGLGVDVTPDLARACFVSHDPSAYWNPQADVFRQTADAPHTCWRNSRLLPTSPPDRSVPLYDGFVPFRHDVSKARRDLDKACLRIQSAPEGQRHHTRFRWARLVGGHIGNGSLPRPEAEAALLWKKC